MECMKRPVDPAQVYASESDRPDAYQEFDATELYCPKCKRSGPVRKRLLLILPEGDKYEYLCAFCEKRT